MKNWLKRKWLLLVVFAAVLPAASDGLINLYDNRDRLYSNISYALQGHASRLKSDEYWAEKLMEGGYILHVRHAERQKWIDVTMYDALESDVHDKGPDQSRMAENDYFADAVCLNSRGKIQARAMGELLEEINFPVGYVISSPSCRARQTAELAFGGYDALDRLLVHRGPYLEKLSDNTASLAELYAGLPVQEGTNTVVSAHNGVIHPDMFAEFPYEAHNYGLEEGGFYVISQREEGLVMEHRFRHFQHFIKNFFTR